MVECPKCKEEVEELTYNCNLIEVGSFFLQDKTDPFYDSSSYENASDFEFHCPYCDEKLFTSEANALAFLKEESRVEEGKEVEVE